MAIEKSPDAFRTISEVAEELSVPAHVLRFWESRFTQIKPVKRAGGRRYYRRSDIELLDGIRRLLHDDGLTIRGVQKLLREQGIRSVAGLARPMGGTGTEEDAVTVDETAVLEQEVVEGNSLEVSDAVPASADDGRDAARDAEPDAGSEDRSARDLFDEPASVDESHPEGPQEGNWNEVPEAPMAQDVVPPDEEPRVLQFLRHAPVASSEPAAPATPMEEPQESQDGSMRNPDRPDDLSPAVGADPSAPPLPEVGPDPEDDDPAFIVAPLDLSRITADPARLRPIYDRLVAIRRRLGDAPRRGPGN